MATNGSVPETDVIFPTFPPDIITSETTDLPLELPPSETPAIVSLESSLLPSSPDEPPTPVTIVQTIIQSRQTTLTSRTLSSSLSTSTSLNTPTVTTPSPSAHTSAPAVANTGISTGAKAGIGVGAALGVLLIAIAAFYMGFRWRRRSDPAPFAEDNAVHEIDGGNVGVAQGLHPPEKFPAYAQRNISGDVDEWLPHKAQGVVR